MEKQVKIEVRGGCVVSVTTNFEGSYQIIDWDNGDDYIGDVYEPDLIEINSDIFEL